MISDKIKLVEQDYPMLDLLESYFYFEVLPLIRNLSECFEELSAISRNLESSALNFRDIQFKHEHLII